MTPSPYAQGCPLSPIPFLFITEGFSRYLQDANVSFEGITIDGKCLRISQFADDTVLFLRNYNQIHHIFNTLLPLFQDATGMLVNVTKTEGLQLEVPKDIPTGIEWCREGSYIISLGAPIGNGFDVRAFWLTKYYKCKSILSNWWSLYRYTVYGKAMLANAMIYSRFRYWAQTLHMPTDIAQAIDSDVQALICGKEIDFDPEELGTAK